MENLRKRVKAIFAKPERELTATLPELQQLKRQLEQIPPAGPGHALADSIEHLVYFFDMVSRWHDRGISNLIAAFEEVNYGQYNGVLEKLQRLQKHFTNAGRNEYGWNRTKRGETVTADKVFLGNIYGLFTHPVHFWMQMRNAKKGGWGYSGMEHLNAYDVVSEQARQFMASHVGPMITILNDLEAVAA